MRKMDLFKTFWNFYNRPFQREQKIKLKLENAEGDTNEKWPISIKSQETRLFSSLFPPFYAFSHLRPWSAWIEFYFFLFLLFPFVFIFRHTLLFKSFTDLSLALTLNHLFTWIVEISIKKEWMSMHYVLWTYFSVWLQNDLWNVIR